MKTSVFKMLATLCCLHLFAHSFAQYYDGPITFTMYVTESYVGSAGNDPDIWPTTDSEEHKWDWLFYDNANGYSDPSCISYNTNSYSGGWHNHSDVLLQSEYSNVSPSYINWVAGGVNTSSYWEDDGCGSSCNYNTGCANNDDDVCYLSSAGSGFNPRVNSPNSYHTLTFQTSSGCGLGARIRYRYSTPRPSYATTNDYYACPYQSVQWRSVYPSGSASSYRESYRYFYYRETTPGSNQYNYVATSYGSSPVNVTMPATAGIYRVRVYAHYNGYTSNGYYTFSQQVFQDNTPPSISCPPSASYTVSGCGRYTTYQTPTANDNCGIASLVRISGLYSGAFFPVGTTTVTWRATDYSGNTSTCSFDITVRETTPPTIYCPSDITTTTDYGQCTDRVFYSLPYKNDNCYYIPNSSIAGFTDLGYYGGSRYYVSNGSLPGPSARANAIARGGHLAVLSHSGENSYVRSRLAANGVTRALIGLNDRSYEGEFQWDTGDHLNYQQWISGEPNNSGGNEDYVEMLVSSGGQWNDISGSVYRRYVVEFDNRAVLTSGRARGGNFPVGVSQVCYQATDLSGNSSTCCFNVTVNDNQVPTTLCQSATVNLGPSGTAHITASDVDNGSSDNCGISSYSVSPAIVNCSDVGTLPVTLTVTDIYGNENSCIASVTVQENDPPAAVCQDITVYLDSNGDASITAEDVDGGSGDNCNSISLSIDNTDFSCVDVIPEVGSSAGFAGRTITYDAVTINGESTQVKDVAPGSSVSLYFSYTNTYTSTYCPGCIQQYYLGLDGDGVDETCMYSGSTNYTFSDAETINFTAPVAPGVYTVSMSSSLQYNCVIRNHALRNPCSSNGLVAVITVGGSGNQTVLTVTDDSGNESTCAANVTVLDTVSPEALCADITVVLDENGEGSIEASDIDNGSNDACGIFSTTIDVSDFDCADAGDNPVTLTIVDNNCNDGACVGTVTVVDSEYPVAECQDITIYLDANGDASITVADVDNGSSDNCGNVALGIDNSNFGCVDVIPAVGSSAGFAGRTITYDAVTINGESTQVKDVAPGSSVSLYFAYTNTYTSSYCPGCIQQYYLGLDGDGVDETCMYSGSTNYTFSDAETINFTAPVVPGVYTVSMSSSLQYNCVVRNHGMRNPCSTNGLVAVITVGGTGNQTMLTVTDDSGNQSTCIANVTVEDTVAPIALCNDITVELDASGEGSVTAGDIDGGSSDACGIFSTSIDAGNYTCSDIGDHVVTLIVKDNNCNESSCTANVSVEDNEAPMAVCQDVTVYLDGSGSASTTASNIDGGSSDNCGSVSLSIDNGAFTCADVGANTILLTADDGNGNSATCTGVVTVVDSTSPSAVCQDITVYVDGTGNASITAGDLDGGSNDNCGSVSLNIDNSDFTCGDVGANTILLTVNDANGNNATCTGVVTVVDSTSPTALCQDLTVYLDGAGNASITPGDVDSGSNDNCNNVSLNIDNSAFTCADVGANTILLTADDGNGNSATCTGVVTVVDSTSPTAVCQDITVHVDGTGNVSITAGDLDGGSNDNCGTVTLSIDSGDFTCGDVGTNTILLSVNDANGNNATCTGVVTVVDSTSPSALCKDITVQLGSSGIASIAAMDVDDGSSDNCGPIGAYAATPVIFDCSNVGPVTVTLTVTDLNGNTAMCTSVATVEDNVAPVPVCTGVTVFLDASGNASITPADVDGGSMDNCDPAPALSIDRSTFGCEDAYDNLLHGTQVSVILTVTDIYSNASTCEAMVNVEYSGQDDDCDGVGNECDICPNGDDTYDYNGDGVPDCWGPGFDSLITYDELHPDFICANNPNQEKLRICHSSGSGSNEQCINVNAWESHEDHGDNLGPCMSCDQAITMPEFEGPVFAKDDERFEVFPNPASTDLTIRLTDFEEGPASIKIFSSVGQVVWVRDVDNISGEYLATIDLYDQFTPGVYFVTIVHAGAVQAKEIVIQRN